jgi:hypothetical protein
MRTDQIEVMLRLIAERDTLRLPQKAFRRMVQKKLKELADTGFVKRIVPPVLPDTRTGPPFFIYTLTKPSATMVADWLGMTLSQLGWRPADDVTFLFLSHILALVEYKLLLTQACLAKGVNLADFVSDRILRREPARVVLMNDTGEHTPVSIVPDAYYALELPSGHVLPCCLEIDRGTSTVATSKWQAKSWRRKVMAYQALQQGIPGSTWAKPGFIVTTVTTSLNRMAHLRSVCEETGGGSHFWFTTFDRLKHDTVLTGAIWQVAGKDDQHLGLMPE